MYRKSLSYLKILVCAAFMMVTVSAVSPSAEAVVVESSGDGMFLYNGVMLPELPNYDSEVYSYVFIFSWYSSSASAYEYQLYIARGSLHWGESSGSWLSLNSSGDTLVYDLIDGQWSLIISSGSNFSITYSDTVWANFDILTSDGSTYLSASDPVPFDPDLGIDFSNTELIISNPEYDFQSATFDVSWSGLPEIPYPDDIQYYLTALLNDASSSTHPYTYIGSSSDPPSGDVPVSFTFDELQPSTEYSATVELRYASGDNASFDTSVSSGVTASVSFTTLSDGSISEGDKAIIDVIQNTNQQHELWIDSEMGSAVGDLNEDVAAAEQQINDLNNQEEAFKDDAFARFQEVSASFSGFDGTVGSGIGLAGTLFSRFFNCLGDYAIIYTFPLILGLAMVIIGRLSRSSFSLEGKDSEKGGE